MKNRTREWEVLDLTDTEAKVLWALIEGGTQSVSGTARKADVPRTTAISVLRRLHERKLVRRISNSGQRKLWGARQPEKIRRELLATLAPFARDVAEVNEHALIGNIQSDEIGISVFKGREQIHEVYKKMLELSKAERVRFIQGNQSADFGAATLDRDFIKKFSAAFKKRGVIMEGVNGERVKNLFVQADLPFLEASHGRAIIGGLLPDSYMEFETDLVIVRDMVIIVHLKEDLAILIRNAALVDMFNHLSRFLHDSSKRFDLNAYVKQLIEERKDA